MFAFHSLKSIENIDLSKLEMETGRKIFSRDAPRTPPSIKDQTIINEAKEYIHCAEEHKIW